MNRRNLIFGSAALFASLFAAKIYWPSRWKYIVIHHSGGNYGNVEHLQQVHRERQPNDPVDAIPYHYIIGNGNGMAVGEIASDSRKQYDLWGAHVSSNNKDRNFRGIGICLIGNFELNSVPQKQYSALVKLTKSLMSLHSIPVKYVTGHGLTPGEKTKCPGKHFPMESFLAELSTT